MKVPKSINIDSTHTKDYKAATLLIISSLHNPRWCCKCRPTTRPHTWVHQFSPLRNCNVSDRYKSRKWPNYRPTTPSYNPCWSSSSSKPCDNSHSLKRVKLTDKEKSNNKSTRSHFMWYKSRLHSRNLYYVLWFCLENIQLLSKLTYQIRLWLGWTKMQNKK